MSPGHPCTGLLGGSWLPSPPPKKKTTQPLNPVNYRSPLSVAGPGRGQGPGRAGGEGLQAGCARARVKFRTSSWTTGREGLLTAMDATVPSLGLLAEKHTCPEEEGLLLLLQDLRFGLGDDSSVEPRYREPRGAISPGYPLKPKRLRGEGEGRLLLRGPSRRPEQSLRPARGSRIGGSPDLRQDWSCACRSGRGFGRPRAGRGWQHAPGFPFGYSAAERPRGQRGILASGFPTDLSKGQEAYADDFNKYFWRNIITEHELGFNSRLITR